MLSALPSLLHRWLGFSVDFGNGLGLLTWWCGGSRRGAVRVWHVLQSPILVANEACIDALEVYVLVGPRFQYQIDGFIGTKQNPRSTQVDVEFSRMLVEDFRGIGGNFDVGVKGTRGER